MGRINFTISSYDKVDLINDLYCDTSILEFDWLIPEWITASGEGIWCTFYSYVFQNGIVCWILWPSYWYRPWIESIYGKITLGSHWNRKIRISWKCHSDPDFKAPTWSNWAIIFIINPFLWVLSFPTQFTLHVMVFQRHGQLPYKSTNLAIIIHTGVDSPPFSVFMSGWKFTVL